MMHNAFLEKFQASPLNEAIVEVRGYANEMTIEVKPEFCHSVLATLKAQFGFNYLTDITASDYYTDEKRFEVSYNIMNISDRMRLRISCRIVDEDAPEVDSAVDIWGSAEWYEREAYDMLGIKFCNHPDLRRIYMPEDFEYFPLRKEFPLLGIPGSIQLPEKDEPKGYK